ncbi:MAG: hypothetical protein Kow00124_16860 [Anaerolineae bacterium]
MEHDDSAKALADLEVRRDRTLADLDAVQVALRSVRRAMQDAAARQDEVNITFIDQLQRDDLDEAERQRIYREWGAALTASSDDLDHLAAEHKRLQVQEVLLGRMLEELDRRIVKARTDLS